MKIFKNSIAGFVMLLATNAMANNADMVNSTREQKLQQYTFEASLHQIEQNLIRDYLTEAYQEEVSLEKENEIKIFNDNEELVYQGISKMAKDLVDKSSYLFDHDGTDYYLINE
jgi:hypothetical protein